MKLVKAASIVAGAGILAAAGLAQAQAPSPYYFRLDTGYSWATDINLTPNAGVAGGPASPLTDGGNAWIAGLGVGYRFSKEFRADLVGSYRGGYKIKEADLAGNFWNGTFDSWSLLANGYVDLPISNRVTGYFGAGAGMAYNQTDGLVNVTNGSVFGGDNKYNFAWNAMVGVSVPVSGTVTIDVGYRYMDLGNFDTAGTSGKLRANELQFGLRF